MSKRPKFRQTSLVAMAIGRSVCCLLPSTRGDEVRMCSFSARPSSPATARISKAKSSSPQSTCRGVWRICSLTCAVNETSTGPWACHHITAKLLFARCHLAPKSRARCLRPRLRSRFQDSTFPDLCRSLRRRLCHLFWLGCRSWLSSPRQGTQI
jgi:hypothetical protein